MPYTIIPAQDPGTGTVSPTDLTGFTATRIPFGDSATALTTSADLTYNDTTNDLSLSVAESGGTVGFSLVNSSNTASSAAGLVVQVAGGTAADPIFQSVVSGVTTWSWGADNSASDAWKIAPNADVGTSTALTISVDGDVGVGTAPDSGYKLLAQDSGDAFIACFGTGAGARANVAASANGASETEAAVMRAGANDAASTLMGVANASSAFFYGKSAIDNIVIGGTKASSVVILAPNNAEVARFTSAGLTFVDAVNIAVNATTGTKIGTATTQKLSFFNATPVVQRTVVADPAGGATIDAEARTAIIAVITRLEELGLFASA